MIRSVVITLVIVLMTACSVNPVTGKKELSLMSEAQEIAMGKQSDPQIVAQFGLYEDEEMQKFINEKGVQMAAISHRPDLPYEFKIVNSPVVNAFAVPGGYVYFTRGIMAHFNNEAEFAGVLGHEIGHVTARHSAKQYTSQMLGQILFIGGLIMSEDFRQFAQEASMGMQLLFLSFGRKHESESDKLGVDYSTEVGYDAHYMANFFKTLARMRSQSTEAQAIPTFLSTHPDPLDRYQNVERMATERQQAKEGMKFAVNRNSYLEMIDGLVYGEDPREGYVENGYFYHPELKFQYPLPTNWRVQNSPQQVAIAAPGDSALIILQLAQGNSLEEAAQAFVDQHKLTPVERQNTRVNGFQAYRLLSDLVPQTDPNTGAAPQGEPMRILSYFIQDGELIYLFIGVANRSIYHQYSRDFHRTMEGFRRLTDQSKINVVPERIDIRMVRRTGTLEQVFTDLRVPRDKWETLSILNSMELTETVAQGTQIKTLRKS